MTPWTPEQLSRDLREGQSADLSRRRWVVGLSLLGVAMGQIVSLYQTGVIRRLPDPPLTIFDSQKVDASAYAYKRLATPDALLMILTYGVTAALAAAGGQDRATRTPWLPLLTAAKVLTDTATAAELAREEWGENRKLCAYCQVATLASVASLFFALPEARTAWGALRKR